MSTPKYRRMFDYDKNMLPNAHLRNLEQDAGDIETATRKSGLTIGYPGWNLLYYTVLCSLRRNEYNIVIETGTNHGCSTIILAQALKDSGYSGRVHSVEIDKGNYEIAQANMEQAGLASDANLHLGDSLEFLTGFDYSAGPLTVCFLDGNHEEDHVVREFKTIHPHLDHKSVVFFDNTARIDHEGLGVNQALQRIHREFGGNLVNFENTSWFAPGQAIWQKDPFRNDWA